MRGKLRCLGSGSLPGLSRHHTAAHSARHLDRGGRPDAGEPDPLHGSADQTSSARAGQYHSSSAQHAVLQLPSPARPASEASRTIVALTRDAGCPLRAERIFEAFAEIL